MKLSQQLLIEKDSRLHEVIYRGFKYDREAEVWYHRKAKKQRLEDHSSKCFDLAHHMIRKHFAKEGITWGSWKISMVGRVSQGDWYANRVHFQINKTDKSK
jgi:hypothetical protein